MKREGNVVLIKENIHSLVVKQNQFFETGATLPVETRIAYLKKIKEYILKNEDVIAAALKADLGKSPYESYLCEIAVVLAEVNFMLKNIRKLTKDKTVATPFGQQLSHSYVKAKPLGTVLIMSPWNYPFLLTIDPLANAIAAGNTAIIKPSAYSPATGAVVRAIVEECFPPEYVAVVTGGRAENAKLLEKKFDFIFFTGSQNVGREVLRRAAEHLTPVSLELGGKRKLFFEAFHTAEVASAVLHETPVPEGRPVFYAAVGQLTIACDKHLAQGLETLEQSGLRCGRNGDALWVDIQVVAFCCFVRRQKVGL